MAFFTSCMPLFSVLFSSRRKSRQPARKGAAAQVVALHAKAGGCGEPLIDRIPAGLAHPSPPATSAADSEASQPKVYPAPVRQAPPCGPGLQASFGVAHALGGRATDEDRCALFSLALSCGTCLTVAAVMDGHHSSHVSQLVADELPAVLRAEAEAANGGILTALAATVRALDDRAHAGLQRGAFTTGGTTLVLHVFAGNAVYTATVGDSKTLLSVGGLPKALTACHAPASGPERARFEAAGIKVASDSIDGCELNVTRSIGDYDLGAPLKWRDEEGRPAGPLSSEADVSVHVLRPEDEFMVIASDGLWDFCPSDALLLTDARRTLRSSGSDAQRAADWLVESALARQRSTLHEDTPGDNVAVIVVSLRPLPAIQRVGNSRLKLKPSS